MPYHIKNYDAPLIWQLCYTTSTFHIPHLCMLLLYHIHIYAIPQPQYATSHHSNGTHIHNFILYTTFTNKYDPLISDNYYGTVYHIHSSATKYLKICAYLWSTTFHKIWYIVCMYLCLWRESIGTPSVSVPCTCTVSLYMYLVGDLVRPDGDVLCVVDEGVGVARLRVQLTGQHGHQSSVTGGSGAQRVLLWNIEGKTTYVFTNFYHCGEASWAPVKTG